MCFSPPTPAFLDCPAKPVGWPAAKSQIRLLTRRVTAISLMSPNKLSSDVFGGKRAASNERLYQIRANVLRGAQLFQLGQPAKLTPRTAVTAGRCSRDRGCGG